MKKSGKSGREIREIRDRPRFQNTDKNPEQISVYQIIEKSGTDHDFRILIKIQSKFQYIK
jgi:hypothetical protein